MSYLYQMDMENTVPPPPYFGVAESKTSLILPIRDSGVELWGGPNERWGVLKNRAMHSVRVNMDATTRYATHTGWRGTLSVCLFFFGMNSL